MVLVVEGRVRLVPESYYSYTWYLFNPIIIGSDPEINVYIDPGYHIPQNDIDIGCL